MKAKSYTQLTLEKRYQIYAFKKAGYSQAQIAREILVAASTVSRELKRNCGLRGYRPQQAQRKATERLCERAAAPDQRSISSQTWQLVDEKLRQEWSPEQISGWLTQHHPESVSHERIYQYIYADQQAGGTLHRHLRCQKKRRKRYAGGQSRRGQIANATRITQRPEVVEERSRLGDWEGDTIIGKGHSGAIVSHSGAIVSLVERKSRFTLLKKVQARTSEAVGQAMIEMMSQTQQVQQDKQTQQERQNDKLLTITLDNGKEFAGHEAVATALKVDVYFAHPYSSWERGTNENTNGLVRQYFPKDCNFGTLTQEHIEHVMQRLNNRPRKTLNFRTPHQVFYELQTLALTT